MLYSLTAIGLVSACVFFSSFDANVSVLYLSLGLRGMVKRACKTSGTIWRSVYFRFSLIIIFSILTLCSHFHSGVQGRLTQAEGEDEENVEENKSDGDAMEE